VGIGQFAGVMISTQLDLFGGPPKPPKNIREEEPLMVKLSEEENAALHIKQPDVAVAKSSPEELASISDTQPDNDEMPEWIDEPLREDNSEADEKRTYEPFSGELDGASDVYDSEDEDFGEPDVEPDAEEEYEARVEAEEGKNIITTSKETYFANTPEDSVHVQFPGHHTNPVNFTTLIPVENFVAEEPAEETETTPNEDNDESEVTGNKLSGIDSDATESEMQEEEQPLQPLTVEAISTQEVIIGGVTKTNADAANTEVAEETKDGQLQIPEDEKLFLRQYYTMRETSNMFGVNQSLLRYWENEFDVLKPKKNRKGDRYFRPEDIKNLELIYHLLKVRKFTIEGAREYIKSKKKVLDTFELVQRLEKLKFFLHELKTHL
jgi:DNA-binding transcriptional MerR regulator